MISAFINLNRALALNSSQSFEIAYKTIKPNLLSPLSFTIFSEIMLKAHYAWDFAPDNFISEIISRVKNPKESSLEYYIETARLTHIFKPSILENSIHNLEKALQNYHPQEISVSNSIQLLKVLNESLYLSDKIIDYINQNILGSNLPSGKLGQELCCLLTWYYIETQCFNNQIWHLIHDYVLPLRFGRFSFLHRISMIHALSLTDIPIPENLLKSFYDISYKNLDTNLVLEAFQVYGNLMYFKDIRSFTNNYEEIKETVKEYKKNLEENPPVSSRFHKEVEGLLVKARIDYKSEYIVEEPYYMRVDLFLEPNKVIEVQGPYHYVKPKGEESIKTRKKHQMLRGMGYEVKTVPYYLWEKLSEDEKMQMIVFKT